MITAILTILLLVLSVVYAYLKYYVYAYWHRKGFPYIAPSIPFGNLASVANREESFGMNIYNLYKKLDLPYVGIYMLFRPTVLIRDAELAQQVLVSDFNSFHDRGIYSNAERNPISCTLFAMQKQEWKALRNKLTPAFTSGKLKSMLPTIMVEGDTLQNHLVQKANSSEVVEMKDLLSRYSLNIIGSVAFGIEADTITNPDHEFRSIERKINNPSFVSLVRDVAVFLCPKVIDILHLPSVSNSVRDFLVNIVKKTIEHREKNNVTRKDLMQSLIQLRATGKVHDGTDNIWHNESSADILKSMSIEMCAAQVYLFYLAGFDTSSSAISFLVFELSRNSKILRKVQAEIDETLERHNGELTYECIQEMTYLDMCVMETLRKYPTLPILNRECTSDYNIPGTDHTIEKGTAIVISMLGLTRDPKYFEDPETFLPDRFLPGSPAHNSPAYMPFGAGPRTCIGLRLGKMITKVGCIKLLQKFDFEALDSSELEIDNYAVTLMIKGGINLRITNRIK